MPVTYYATKPELSVPSGNILYTSHVLGIENLIGNGRDSLECGENARLALRVYRASCRETGTPMPESVFAEGALELLTIGSALVVQRFGLLNDTYHELLTHLDFDPTFTNNLKDAESELERKAFDLVISDDMFRVKPHGQVKKSLWKDLYEKSRGAAFVLNAVAPFLDKDLESYQTMVYAVDKEDPESYGVVSYLMIKKDMESSDVERKPKIHYIPKNITEDYLRAVLTWIIHTEITPLWREVHS